MLRIIDRKTSARLGSLLLFLFATAFAAGCGAPIRVLDVRDDAAKWRAARDAGVNMPRYGTIKVRIIGTPTMAELGTTLLPLGSSAPGDDEKSLRQLIEKRGAASGVLVRGVGEAARRILASNLARYYENVDVELTPTPATDFGGTTVAQLQLSLIPGFYTRTATFSWIATSPDGATVSASATPPKANAAAHLAWALPLGLLTFPLGLAIAQPIFASIYTGMEEAKAIQAIDAASASLAAQLAAARPSATRVGLAP